MTTSLRTRPLPRRLLGRARRLANYALIQFQRRYFRRETVWGYPLHWHVEPTNHCNLRCPLCPTGQGRTERPRGLMPLESFERILAEIGDYAWSINLSNWGEALLHRDSLEMVRLAKSYDIHVEVSCNFTRLRPEQIEAIVTSGLDVLFLSIDGATQETYAKYRVGGNLEDLLENARQLVACRRRLGSTTPAIVWNFIVNRHNESEIEAARAMADEIGVDRFSVLPIRTDMGRELFRGERERRESVEAWLPTDSRHNRYAPEHERHAFDSCDFPWMRAVINWDGSVSPCCSVYPREFDFGNAFEAGFARVWNSERYRKARRILLRKDPVDDETICSYCLKNGFIEF